MKNYSSRYMKNNFWPFILVKVYLQNHWNIWVHFASLVCIVETYMVCSIFHFITWRAKRYQCVSEMFLFFNICNQLMQSHNGKGRRVFVVLRLRARQIWCCGVPGSCSGFCYIVSISWWFFIFRMRAQRLQCFRLSMWRPPIVFREIQLFASPAKPLRVFT